MVLQSTCDYKTCKTSTKKNNYSRKNYYFYYFETKQHFIYYKFKSLKPKEK